MVEQSIKLWRLELFFKKQSDLSSKRIPYLIEHGVQRINLTNKTKDDRLLDSASKIFEEIPEADICIHYSIKWNYNGGEDNALDQLTTFLSDFSVMKGSKSVMLVSGGGKKKRLDTVKALQRLAQQKKAPEVPIHVAFNPYFPEKKDLEEEQGRMKSKLATGLVQGVWMQTGSDIAKLEDGLKFLRRETSKDMQLFGSIFLPDKRLLAQMKYRPWNGVFLSDKYLNSVQEATSITKQLIKCYQKYEVIPLLETALNTKQDMQGALSLLGIA